MDASFRAALRRILPGLPWHQAMAVVTTVWLLFMAAFALAMAQVTGGDDAVANAPQVIVRGGAIASAQTPAPSEDTGGNSSWNPTGDAPDDAGSTGDESLPGADEGLLPSSGFIPSAPLPAEPVSDDGTDPTGGGDAPEQATWPAGKEGYTVLIAGSQKQDEADGKVQEALAVGIEAGMLTSAGFGSLLPDWFVVFTGSYDTLADAKKAADDLALRGYSDSTAVWLSEDRVRRCEDGEQPMVSNPATPTTPVQPADPAPVTPTETTPAPVPDPAPTTPAETTPTTPARPNDPAKGRPRQAPEDEPPVPALTALEKPCEVRAPDDDAADGDDSKTTTGPTVVP